MIAALFLMLQVVVNPNVPPLPPLPGAQAAAPQVAQEPAAPFGLKMGMTKSEVSITKEGPEFKMILSAVPKPHPEFKEYLSIITPKQGLCYIQAHSPDIATSAYGYDLRTKFEDVRTQLDEVYGHSKLADELGRGSIWKEPRDWMMAILKKDRYLMATWTKANGSAMKPGLQTIGLGVSATSSDRGYVWLEYYFDNYDACKAEATAQQKTVL